MNHDNWQFNRSYNSRQRNPPTEYWKKYSRYSEDDSVYDDIHGRSSRDPARDSPFGSTDRDEFQVRDMLSSRSSPEMPWKRSRTDSYHNNDMMRMESRGRVWEENRPVWESKGSSDWGRSHTNFYRPPRRGGFWNRRNYQNRFNHNQDRSSTIDEMELDRDILGDDQEMMRVIMDSDEEILKEVEEKSSREERKGRDERREREERKRKEESGKKPPSEKKSESVELEKKFEKKVQLKNSLGDKESALVGEKKVNIESAVTSQKDSKGTDGTEAKDKCMVYESMDNKENGQKPDETLPMTAYAQNTEEPLHKATADGDNKKIDGNNAEVQTAQGKKKDQPKVPDQLVPMDAMSAEKLKEVETENKQTEPKVFEAENKPEQKEVELKDSPKEEKGKEMSKEKEIAPVESKPEPTVEEKKEDEPASKEENIVESRQVVREVTQLEKKIGTEFCKRVKVHYCKLCQCHLPRGKNMNKVIIAHCRTKDHLQKLLWQIQCWSGDPDEDQDNDAELEIVGKKGKREVAELGKCSEVWSELDRDLEDMLNNEDS